MAAVLAAVLAAALAGCGPRDEFAARPGLEEPGLAAFANDQASPAGQPGAGYIDSDVNRIRHEAFVTGAALFTLYHELGHFVMKEYKVEGEDPDGPEAAADKFSALILTPQAVSNPKREMFDPASASDVPPVLWSIAFLRNLQERMDRRGDPYDHEHGSPNERMARLLCLVYGADPARWSTQSVFTTYLTEDKRTSCIDDARKNGEYWAGHLTDRMAIDGDRKVYQAVVRYDSAPPELAAHRRWLIDSGLMEEIGDEIGRLLWADSVPLFEELGNLGRLNNQPRWEINVVGSDCLENGIYQENAMWSPRRRSLILCYGMVKAYFEFATEVLGDMPASTQTAPL
jgi:hypothetical protein